MPDDYTYWRSELVMIAGGYVPTRDFPGTLRRDTLLPVAGFWRILGAKTKWDTPVAIWYTDGKMRLKIGRTDPIGEFETSFMSMQFLSAAAVTEADYKYAIEHGKWPDGKNSRDPKKETPT